MWGGGDMQFAYRLKGATPLRNKSHSLPPTQEVSRGCPVSVRRSVLPVGFVHYAKKSSPACLRRNLEEDAGESRCGALSGRRLKIRSDFPPFLIPDIVKHWALWRRNARCHREPFFVLQCSVRTLVPLCAPCDTISRG